MSDLKISQIRAIHASLDLGRDLQDHFPQIADMWREGYSRPHIVDELEIGKHYGTTKKIAVNAVGYALCGSNGDMGVEAYHGLIEDPEERRKICAKHRAEPLLLGLEAKAAKGREVAQRMGFATWLTEDDIVIDEKALALALTHSDHYRVSVPKRGQRIGDVDNQAIADTLNLERELAGFPTVMTADRVRKGLYKYKKQLERRNGT